MLHHNGKQIRDLKQSLQFPPQCAALEQSSLEKTKLIFKNSDKPLMLILQAGRLDTNWKRIVPARHEKEVRLQPRTFQEAFRSFSSLRA